MAPVVTHGDAFFISNGRFSGPVKIIWREAAKKVGIGTEHGGGVRSVEFRKMHENYCTRPSCVKVKRGARADAGAAQQTDSNRTPLSHNELCTFDANACLNIFAVFTHDTSHWGHRPEEVTHRYQQATHAQ